MKDEIKILKNEVGEYIVKRIRYFPKSKGIFGKLFGADSIMKDFLVCDEKRKNVQFTCFWETINDPEIMRFSSEESAKQEIEKFYKSRTWEEIPQTY